MKGYEIHVRETVGAGCLTLCVLWDFFIIFFFYFILLFGWLGGSSAPGWRTGRSLKIVPRRTSARTGCRGKSVYRTRDATDSFSANVRIQRGSVFFTLSRIEVSNVVPFSGGVDFFFPPRSSLSRGSLVEIVLIRVEPRRNRICLGKDEYICVWIKYRILGKSQSF